MYLGAGIERVLLTCLLLDVRSRGARNRAVNFLVLRSLHMLVLVTAHLFELIVCDNEVTVVADRFIAVVLDANVLIFFRMNKDLFLALLIIEANFVEPLAAGR